MKKKIAIMFLMMTNKSFCADGLDQVNQNLQQAYRSALTFAAFSLGFMGSVFAAAANIRVRRDLEKREQQLGDLTDTEFANITRRIQENQFHENFFHSISVISYAAGFIFYMNNPK